MYKFRDTNDDTISAVSLTAESVSIDGNYIEDMIEGYRTLYTSGREGLAVDLKEQEIGIANGSRILATRYPSRTITVGFQLVASSPQDFRTKFNHLNNLLSAEEADFVFYDEQDKFFTGTPIANIDIEPGKNSVTGEWQIYCADPFKYSVEPIVAEPVTSDASSAEFIIDYQGTYPAKPVLQAEFAGALAGGNSSEDGDCGFVAFSDAGKNIIQLGNPEAVDLDAYASAATPVNHIFTNIDDTWNVSGGTRIDDRAISGSLAVNQNISDQYWSSGKGQTLPFVKPNYGSGTGWHGPGYWKQMAGGGNFEVSATHRMCATHINQIGCFELSAYAIGDPNKVVAGILIDKNAAGNTAVLRYYVDGEQVGSVSIDLSQYNTHFGYCKRTAVKTTLYYNKKRKKWQTKKIKKAKKKVTNKYTYTQSNLNIKITKSGKTVNFKVGNAPARAFTADGLEGVIAGALGMYYGAYADKPQLHTNATHSVKVVRQPSTLFSDISNVFTAGDLVEADTGDATVTIRNADTEEGHLAPQFGALGNDWEDFELSRGVNQIQASWSEWVNPNYAPKVRIIYNEVFI